MAIVLSDYDDAVKIAESNVGAYGEAVANLLRLLPKVQPLSIKIRKTIPGVLVFYGISDEIAAMKKSEYIDFEFGRMKKFSYRRGVGLQVEFFQGNYLKPGFSKDWDLK